MNGAWAWLRGLVHFVESAGATLTRRGGGAELTLTENFGVHTGKESRTRAYGERAHAAGSFDDDGDAQHGAWHARGETSDATPLILRIDAGAENFVPEPGEIYYIRAKICAGEHGAQEALVTEIKWAVTRWAGTTAQLGSTNTSFKEPAASTWAVAPYHTGNIITARVTGEAAKQIRWSAEFQYCLVGKSG